MVPVLPCEFSWICTWTLLPVTLLTRCKMTAISTVNTLKIRYRLRLCSNDRCLINTAGRRTSEDKNLMLNLLFFLLVICTSERGGWMCVSDSLQSPMLPSSSFWYLSRELCQVRKLSFLFLCDFFLNDRIHFNFPFCCSLHFLPKLWFLTAGFLFSSDFLDIICISSHKLGQFFGMCSVVKGIATISQSVGL